MRSDKKLWRFTTGDMVISSPAIASGVVYVGSGADDRSLELNALNALDARTGNKLWRFTTGNSIDSSPVVANGIVYVGSDAHSLYALGARVQPLSVVDNSDISPTPLTSRSRLLILPSQKETVPAPHFKPRGF